MRSIKDIYKIALEHHLGLTCNPICGLDLKQAYRETSQGGLAKAYSRKGHERN